MSQRVKERQPVSFRVKGEKIGDGDLYPDGSLIIRHETGIRDGMEIEVVDSEGQILAIGVLADAGVIGGAKLINATWMT